MNKAKIGLLLIAMFALMSINVVLAEDVLNPNYGTTTFFSNKDEKPSNKVPIYDAGAKAGKKSKDDGKDSGIDSGGGLFNQIIDGIGGLFGGTNDSVDNATKNSLFDLQNNSNGRDNANSADSGNGGEFIMGSRGENIDNLNDEDAAKYANKISSGFNFRDDNSTTTPKRSKLIFTSIVIPIDLTTQYVLVGLVIVTAVGLAIGYYLWKKEETKDKKKYSEEDYQ